MISRFPFFNFEKYIIDYFLFLPTDNTVLSHYTEPVWVLIDHAHMIFTRGDNNGKNG